MIRKSLTILLDFFLKIFEICTGPYLLLLKYIHLNELFYVCAIRTIVLLLQQRKTTIPFETFTMFFVLKNVTIWLPDTGQ